MTPIDPDAAPDAVLLRHDDAGVATLTLNRPRQYNALSQDLLAALQHELDAISADRSVRVVVLAANGPGFCAGHDLKEISALPDQAAVEALFVQCSRMMMAIGALPQPVVARVHGVATAAGCQLVAACDLVVASSAASFATSGVNNGIFCTTPGVALGRVVSRKHAMEMLLTGAVVSAQRAYEMGLVNRVVAPEALDTETNALVQILAGQSSAVLASGKRVFYQQLELGLPDAYAMASCAIAEGIVQPDGQEGIAAFLAKRKPVWS